MSQQPCRWTTLITGGCGFVGRHLARRLLGLGHNLYLVDDLSTGEHPDVWLADVIVGRREMGDRIVYEVADVSVGGPCTVTFEHGNIIGMLQAQMGDSAGVPPQSPWPNFAAVFHLASIVGGRLKIDGDPLHVGVDLAIDSLFFRWATLRREQLGRVLYASSSAAYPVALQQEQGHVALAESMLEPGAGIIGQPDMTYGWSKLTGEYLAHLAASRYGLKVAVVRPFSGYGEDQDLCYPVAAIALRVAQGENPVTVWGSGEQGRDFIHIDDCITAMLRASARITDGSAVNIGTGTLTTFMQLARLLVRLHGRQARVVPQLDRPEGVQSRYADVAHMRHVLDFTPAVTLEAGMARVLRAAVQRHRQAQLQAAPTDAPRASFAGPQMPLRAHAPTSRDVYQPAREQP